MGVSPYNAAGNPSDEAKVFPVEVAKLESLTAAYDVSYSGNLGGFNVAFYIWLANSATGTGESAVTNEIMIWLHQGGFAPFGDPVGTYKNGDFSATIYHKGTYTALVADRDWTKGTIDIADVIDTLKDMGIVSDTEYLRSVELGSEVTSGTGSLTINDLQLNVKTHDDAGAVKSYLVDGNGTTLQGAPDNASATKPAVPSNVEKVFDDNGHQIGTKKTEVVSAAKTVATIHDLAGNLLGTDVTTIEKDKLVQHFDRNYLLTSAERTSTNADGSVQTVAFDSKWAIAGSWKVSVNGAETKTQYYDANWKPSGMTVEVKEANGATTLRQYDASWKFTGAERVTSAGNATTTQTWNSSWQLLSMDKVVIGTDGTSENQLFDAAGKLVEKTLTGTAGDNTFMGGAHTTHFHGGLGADTLTGGTGVDFFHFDTPAATGGADTIRSFNAATDKIVLERDVFAGLSAGPLAASAFVTGTVALDANDRIIFDKATQSVFYDADGSGAAQQVLLAHIDLTGTLSSSNFSIA